MSETCSAYRAGPHLCANGFPQNAACMGAKCHCCGRPTDQIPVCMRDEVPEHLTDESGRPRFVKLSTASPTSDSAGAAE